MLLLAAGCVSVAVVLGSAMAQQTPAGVPAQEFPVIMRQNVVAGETPVGAKVGARLTIATFVSGKVIPAGATLSGEVVVSDAKTADKPSRLAIRVDSAHWKKESVAIKAYLTSWYYPLHLTSGDDHSLDAPSAIHGEVGVAVGGSRDAGRRPSPVMPPSEGSDFPPPPVSTLSEHRVKMKDVDSFSLDGGGTAITSSRETLKLDKTTTYVLASGDLPATK